MSKAERQQMTDRQLLESLHERLDGITERLAEGDKRFALIEGCVRDLEDNVGLLLNSVHALCKARGLEKEVAGLNAGLERLIAARDERRPQLRDEKTSPGE
jgi:hypothetical protein